MNNRIFNNFLDYAKQIEEQSEFIVSWFAKKYKRLFLELEH